MLSSNIKKEPLKSVVTFLKKNFSDKYPKAVESLVVKVNATKVDLAGLIISFVQLSQPHTCLICNSDYLPYSNNDSTDVGSEANVKCFICKTPSHDTCVNETVVSEHQGIVFLCYNCIERKKANELDIPQPNTTQPPPNGSDSSLSSDETSGSDSSHKKSKKNPRKSLEAPKKDQGESSKQKNDQKLESDADKNKSKEKVDKVNKSKEDANKSKEDDTKSQEDANKTKIDKICSLLMEGKCPHGISGKTCKYKHKRYCWRYCSFGDSRYHRSGCKYGKECRFLHPKLCQNSVTMKKCYNQQCTLTHLRFTVRKKDDYYKNHQHSSEPRQYGNLRQKTGRDKKTEEHPKPKQPSIESKTDDIKEGDATIKPNPKEDMHFLGPALERMQKELSNLIQVQIQQQFQQQMQLQQQIQLHLQKGSPQMMHNWLSVANPSLQMNHQMPTVVNQKVPPTSNQSVPSPNQW